MEWKDLDVTNKNSKIRAFGRKIDPTNTPKFTPPPAPVAQTPQQAGNDVAALMAQFKIDPKALESQRTAQLGQIAGMETAARNRSDQAAANRGTGAYRSGAQQSNLARIGVGYDQLRNQTNAGIDSAKNATGLQALQAALAMRNGTNAFNLGAAGLSGQGARDAYSFNNLLPWQQQQQMIGTGMNLAGNAIVPWI